LSVGVPVTVSHSTRKPRCRKKPRYDAGVLSSIKLKFADIIHSLYA